GPADAGDPGPLERQPRARGIGAVLRPRPLPTPADPWPVRLRSDLGRVRPTDGAPGDGDPGPLRVQRDGRSHAPHDVTAHARAVPDRPPTVLVTAHALLRSARMDER